MLKKVEVYKCHKGHIKLEKETCEERICTKCGSKNFTYLGPSIVTKEDSNDNK